MTGHRRRSALALAAVSCMLCSTGNAADAESLEALDRVRVSLGVFSNQLSLEGRVDGSAILDGSERDFDDELDIGKRRSVELYELGWRPFERHELSLRHYRDERQQSASIDEELRFAGEVFPIQASAQGRAAFRASELSYTGWLHAAPRSAFGLQLGVLKLEASLSIAGEISSPEFGSVSGEASASDRLYAPLAGFSTRRVLGDHVRVFADARAIRLNYRGIDGRAFSASAGIEYFPLRSIGVVLQYSDTWVEAERRTDAFNGKLEIGFSGPQALLRWRL
jgi:hypothetical protein